MPFFNRRKRPASLTIEEDAIRYVRLKSAEPLVIDIAEEVSLPPNTVVEGKIVDAETLTVILEGVVKEWGIVRRDVQFLAPDTYVIIRKVPYPNEIQEDELKGHFFIEIGSSIYLPFEDPVFDVVPYVPSVDEKEAILIASKESIIDQYEDVLKSVKLHPVVADIGPLSLYRLSYQSYAFTEDEHVMIADLKGNSMTVSIFHKHYPLFMRPVDLGQSANIAIVVEGDTEADVAMPSAIVSELEKLINFYRYNMHNGAASVTRLLLNGDYSQMDELSALIQDRFTIEAGSLMKEPARIADGRQQLSASFNRTIGLSLKEVR